MGLFATAMRRSSRKKLAYHMFDLPMQAESARRAYKLQNIYHRGQDLAWDGRDILQELIDEHGGVHVAPDKAAALRNIFAIILWGELAAWKISAQLADQLVLMEAKMAATSQAHDEARHFYVMYDYLAQLGEVPKSVRRPTRVILNAVLETPSLLHKLTGMQLLVEPLALTLFQLVREMNVEPVLTDLVRYFEKDEARHVGLGIQYLPELMREASAYDTAKAIAFQLHLVAWTLRGLKLLEPDLATLGISPRDVIRIGRNKVFTASELLWQGMGIDKPLARAKLEDGIDALCEFLFPREETAQSLRLRVNAARAMWVDGPPERTIEDFG